MNAEMVLVVSIPSVSAEATRPFTNFGNGWMRRAPYVDEEISGVNMRSRPRNKKEATLGVASRFFYVYLAGGAGIEPANLDRSERCVLPIELSPKNQGALIRMLRGG